MAMQTSPTGNLDRQTVVPFHLKLFYRTGGFHSLTDFPTSTSNPSTTNPSIPLPRHLQIYTWPTCTLRELSHLLVSALPSLLPSPAVGTRLSYRLIYPSPTSSSSTAPQPSSSASYLNPPARDQGGRYLAKELGHVVIAPGSSDDDAEEGGGRGSDGRLPTSQERDVMGAAGAGGGLMQGRLAGDPEKTLQDARFVIGDFIDVAVFAPGRDGAVAPPAAGAGRVGGGRGGEMGGRRGGAGRENGYEGGRVAGGYGDREYGGRGGGFTRGGRGGGGMYNGGGGGGVGGASMNGRSREEVPMGEWRRGERLPDGYAGGGGGGGFARGGGGYGRGRGRGGY